MMFSWQDAETVIAQNLIMLTVEGGSGNFMIVSAGDIYVQFAGSRGLSRIQCEAVGNDYLDRQHRLSPEKIAELEKLYFVPQDAPANFAREFQVASEVHARHLAQLALNILEKIYGCDRASPVNLELTLE